MRQRATRVPAPKPQPVQPAKAQPETIPTAESRPAPGLPAEFDENQELLAEALRHLLVYGGHEDDVKGMMRAAMCAYFEREVDPLWNPGETRRTLVCQLAERNVEERFETLKRAWIPAPTLPSLERPAAGATALRLFHVRENLLGQFATFIRSARPSELHLLQEVLEVWWSNNLPADTSSAEIALAEAMAEQLDRSERFIGVPRRYAKLVKQYVGFLKDGESGVRGMNQVIEPEQAEREEALGNMGWAVYTPEESGYRLIMYSTDGGSIQEIDMNREEYLALKALLARMRGLLLASATEAGNHARN